MNIGQIVKIKKFDQLPADMQTQKFKGLAGFEAEIIDVLHSECAQEAFYRLRLTGAKTVPLTFFREDMLELIQEEPAEYVHEIEYLDNVVLVVFYKIQKGKKIEVSRGHGHIIHEGPLGIAQAASYAMKRCYERLIEE